MSDHRESIKAPHGAYGVQDQLGVYDAIEALRTPLQALECITDILQTLPASKEPFNCGQVLAHNLEALISCIHSRYEADLNKALQTAQAELDRSLEARRAAAAALSSSTITRRTQAEQRPVRPGVSRAGGDGADDDRGAQS